MSKFFPARYLALFLSVFIFTVVSVSVSAASARIHTSTRPLTVRINQDTIPPIMELILSGPVPKPIIFPRLGSMRVTVRFRAAGSQRAVVVERTRLAFDGCPESLTECVGYPAYISGLDLSGPDCIPGSHSGTETKRPF
jgi:hypothetical protein